MKTNLRSSIKQSVIWLVIRLVVTLSASVFITVMIVRSLSVKEYGIYTLLFSVLGYFSVIASCGIPSIFQRFVPELRQRKEYQQLKQLVFRGMLMCLLSSLFVISLALLFNHPIGRLLKVDGWINYFGVFGWGILIYIQSTMMTSVLHSLFLHKYSVIASTIFTIFRGFCIFILLRLGWAIHGVIWSEVLSWCLWLLLLLFFYYRNFLIHHPEKGKFQLPVRRYLRYGAFSSLSELGSTIASVSTDFFVISYFLGPGAIAYYAFANRVLRMITNNMPHILFIDVIRPTFFTKYAESGNKQHLLDMFNLIVKMGAFFLFPLAGGIYMLGDNMIIVVFKPEYLAAEKILWILVTSAAIGVYSTPTWLVLQAIERVQITLYSKVFGIYNIVVSIFVIQWFGVMGVLAVSCSAIFLRDLYCYYYAKKLTGLTIDWSGLLKIIINVTIMSLFLWLLRPYVNSIFSLLVAVLIGGAIYLTASWKNKVFSTLERDWVNSIAPRPWFVF